jgi:glyoxylase-like metal-dependent hydrolase (beta-lactamase superfamily II)
MIRYPLQVAPGIFWIRMPLPFKLDHINLWLLKDDDETGPGWTIVDTGYSSEETRALWTTHFRESMRGEKVKRIIVTHYHPDHVGCAAWLHEQTGATVWMTATEFLSAHAAAEDVAGFDRANSAALFVRHGLARLRPDFANAQNTRSAAFKRGVPSVPSQYFRIMDGDVINIGQRAWSVKTFFGHAPEHAVLFCDADRVLISGDQVLPRITTNVGVWGNQPEANPLQLFLGGMSRFETMPAETLVLPSHDRVFSGLHERVAELRLHHEHRLSELETALDTPRCAADVLSVLFKRTLDDHQLVFAIGETIAHLHFLWRSGRATRSLSEDGVYEFQRSLQAAPHSG